MAAILEKIGDWRLGYSFPVGLAAIRHVLPHSEELYMLVDVGNGSKETRIRNASITTVYSTVQKT